MFFTGARNAFINIAMATRNPTNVDRSLMNSTDFQVHKSQQNVFDGMNNVFDFTEYRLRKCIELAAPEQRIPLAKILTKYCKGEIAVSWRGGEPTYIPVTKEK